MIAGMICVRWQSFIRRMIGSPLFGAIGDTDKNSNAGEVVDENHFKNSFISLQNNVWQLQDRYYEIVEFEKGWRAVFDRLESIKGREIRVRILNDNVFRSFRWDRYHILISDLLSLIKHETGNPDSCFRSCFRFLRLGKAEDFLDNNSRVNFIEMPGQNLSEDYRQRRIQEIRMENANQELEYRRQALKRLFPRISESYEVTEIVSKTLISQVKSLESKIEGVRNFLNHKYEEDARERYMDDALRFRLEHLKEVLEKIHRLFSDAALVYQRSSAGEANFGYKRFVEDSLDLILFSSIQGAVGRFYENCSRDVPYHEARRRYYHSAGLASVIAD